jgi:cephalosporin hydroxylase
MIDVVQRCIGQALAAKPTGWFVDYCDEWYSPYYGLMHHLVHAIQPKLCVETGVHNGRGLAALASGGPGVVVGIDCYDHPTLSQVLQHYPNARFIQSASNDDNTVQAIAAYGVPIEILHIDTEHSYGQATADYRSYEPLLAEHAIILFDDVNAMDGAVMQAARDLQLSWLHKEDQLHPITGYAVGVR